MREHEYFEELCSVALIGELSAQESTEFIAHVRCCADCKASFVEFSEIVSEQLPLVAGHAERIDRSSLKHVREGTLHRLAAEGLRITSEAALGPVTLWTRARQHLEDIRWMLFARKTQIAISLSAMALIVVAMLVVRHDREHRMQIESLRANGFPHAVAHPASTNHGEVAQAGVSDDLVRLKKVLDQAGERIARLESANANALRELVARQGKLDDMTSENSSLSEYVAARDSEIANLTGEIEQLRSKVNQSNAELVAAQFQASSLTNELMGQQTAIDQERKLLQGDRDIRDLMSSRNLHIIDVHDMDARGEARPFGRIFLTDRKRLMFYAYDLNSPKIRNAAFQVWGQRTNASRSAVSLGILYVDDQKQSRWALKVEDPDLLSTIDSLFVTVEHPGGATKPTGKKLMYASLQNPINHP
jgi:hypothetical protein